MHFAHVSRRNLDISLRKFGLQNFSLFILKSTAPEKRHRTPRHRLIAEVAEGMFAPQVTGKDASKKRGLLLWGVAGRGGGRKGLQSVGNELALTRNQAQRN